MSTEYQRVIEQSAVDQLTELKRKTLDEIDRALADYEIRKRHGSMKTVNLANRLNCVNCLDRLKTITALCGGVMDGEIYSLVQTEMNNLKDEIKQLREECPVILTGIDTETTGLDPDKGDRIIEIAMIKIDYQSPSNWKVVDIWEQRFNSEGKSIDPKAEKVHGISMADIKNEPTFDHPDCKRRLSDMLCGTDVLFAHNMGFDLNFLVSEMANAGMEFDMDMKSFCTMEEGRAATAMGEIPNLGKLCFTCGVDYDPTSAHAAIYDIEKTAQCLVWGLANKLFPTFWAMMDESESEAA